MKVVISLTKNISAPLGITTAASAIYAQIKKKIHGSGRSSFSAPWTKTLIISNKEMNDIMKIVQIVEDVKIFLKGVTKTIKTKQKNKSEDSEAYCWVF